MVAKYTEAFLGRRHSTRTTQRSDSSLRARTTLPGVPAGTEGKSLTASTRLPTRERASDSLKNVGLIVEVSMKSSSKQTKITKNHSPLRFVNSDRLVISNR